MSSDLVEFSYVNSQFSTADSVGELAYYHINAGDTHTHTRSPHTVWIRAVFYSIITESIPATVSVFSVRGFGDRDVSRVFLFSPFYIRKKKHVRV